MQIDHVTSLYWYGGADDISNYMPACRMCNFYKSTLSLDEFKQRLQTITERLEKDFTYRIARKYGVVKECKEPIEFYFERIKSTEKIADIQDKQKKQEPTYETLKQAYDFQNDIIKRLEKSNKELSDRVVKAEGLMCQQIIKENKGGNRYVNLELQ